MELNRTDRRLLKILGLELTGKESIADIYSRIRLRYRDPYNYLVSASIAVENHFNLKFPQNIPIEYDNSIKKLNPFVIKKEGSY